MDTVALPTLSTSTSTKNHLLTSDDNLANVYKMYSEQRQHIYEIPDTYAGSPYETEETMYLVVNAPAASL
jgi:hypothetical protein